MQSTYAAFVDRMISLYEGKYGWDKSDPGGPTNFGITCYDLAQHRGQKMTSMSKWAPLVKAMPLKEAEDIYATKYAVGIKYDNLPAGSDACMMDYAVNSGVSRAVLVARTMLGVEAAGMSAELVAAINKYPVEKFVKTMNAERLSFMQRIKGGSLWRVYHNGWTSRVNDLTAYCLKIAGHPDVAPASAPYLGSVPAPKATAVPAKAPIASTSAGAIVAPIAGLGAGLPWYVLVGAVVLIVIAGVAYSMFENAKANATNNTVVLPTGA